MLKSYFLFICILICPNSIYATTLCKPVTYGGIQYGPIDYYDSENHIKGKGGELTGDLKDKNKITIVTAYHFNSDIVRLRRGQTSTNISGDLDYTLRALPNHPVALDTVSRFEVLQNNSVEFKSKQKPMPFEADCYFQRAINVFGYNQPQTYMLWGLHKYRQKKYEKAIKYFIQAESLKFKSADLAYYFGLTYFQLGDFDKAQKYSDRAYKMGYQLPGLKNLLKNKK